MHTRVEQFETRALNWELVRHTLCREGRLPGYVSLVRWLRELDRVTRRL
jgi:hypothetical protein